MPTISQHLFQRPSFHPLPPKKGEASGDEAIRSVPDLIRFNTKHNPDHVFCIQAQPRKEQLSASDSSAAPYDGVKITFAELENAVVKCAIWLNETHLQTSPIAEPDSRRPVALYLESDVGLFIHLAALQVLDTPVLLISARLSPASVEHLLEKTGSEKVLVSNRTRALLTGQIDDRFKLTTVEPYTTYLQNSSESELTEQGRGTLPVTAKSNQNERSLILHSSGTTGFPKPIYLTKRYLLQYASCHEFPDTETIDWVNLSTLPLYHGFGFLAPCLSLSIGMTCVFPPSSVIPAGRSTLDLLDAFTCRSLMTVPSIVGDLMTQTGAFERLATLEFLAVGGGAMSPDQGLRLKEQNVNLLNHYGVTEIGAIAPIFRPGPDYNWRYLRLRSDLNLELRPIDESSHFKLVGYPIGWNEHFEVQDELEKNPDAVGNHLEIRILGRTDDVIVLKTGEKIMPQHLEAELMASSAITTAVCIGQGRFETVVLIEPAESPPDEAKFINQVWDLISAKNPSLDRHARVSSKTAIILKPAEKAIPRTDKGSVSRRQVQDVFSDEIEAAYTAVENDLPIHTLDVSNLENSVRDLVKAVFGAFEASADQDFFESGMDSLQAVRLARQLDASLQQEITSQSARDKNGQDGVKVSVELIYRNPTISALTEFLRSLLNNSNSSVQTETASEDSIARINAVSNRFLADLGVKTNESQKQTPKHVVLLTGATGNLGSHTLSQLVQNPSVSKVICLYRQSKEAPLGRIRASVSACGIALSEESWAKVELVNNEEFIHDNDQSRTAAEQNSSNGDPTGDTGDSLFKRLAHDVTHIVHLAWPMDFQRTLESFTPHIEMVSALINLARSARATRKSQREPPVRLLFASSIAVIRNYGKKSPAQSSIVVPEAAMQSPETVVAMGYAEAKWVCERMLNHVQRHYGDEVEPVIARIGQLSGPEASPGVWKTTEHIPALLKASSIIGAVPQLKGVMSWLPVDRASRCLLDVLFHQDNVHPVLHIENPVRQYADGIMTILANELGLSPTKKMPYEEWLKKATEVGAVDSLVEFFSRDFQDLALGKIKLDTTKARSFSRTLQGSRGVDHDLLVEYIRRWKQQGWFATKV